VDWAHVASVTVAAIAAGGAWASQRAAARASVRNAATTSRTDLEKEAFERARAYYSGALERQDVEIARQDAELREVRAELRLVVHDLALREDDVRRLSAIVAAHGES